MAINVKDRFTLPCGGEITVYEHSAGREYYYNGVHVWTPSDIHRVVLQTAILKEDEYKYGEKI